MNRNDIYKYCLFLIVFILFIFHILNNYNIINQKTILYKQVLKYNFNRDLEVSILVIGGNHYLSLQLLNIFNHINHQKIKHVVMINDHYSYHPYYTSSRNITKHNYELQSLCKKGFIDKFLLRFKFTHIINILTLSNISPCFNKLLKKFQYTKYNTNQNRKKPIYIQLLQSKEHYESNNQQINFVTNNIHLKYSLSLIILLVPEYVYGAWITPDMLAYICLEQVINPSILPMFYDTLLNDQTDQVKLIHANSVTMGIMSILLELNLNYSSKSINIISFSKELSLTSEIFKTLIINNINDVIKTPVTNTQSIEYNPMQNKFLSNDYTIQHERISKTYHSIFERQNKRNKTILYNYSIIKAMDLSMINHNNSILEMIKWYISYQFITMPCESECKRSYHNNKIANKINNKKKNNKNNNKIANNNNNNNNKNNNNNINNNNTDYFCFNSGWMSAMQQSKILTKDCPYVVYTVNLFIELEKLNKIQSPYINKTCAIAFIHHDSKLSKDLRLYQRNQISNSNWTIVKVNDLTLGFSDSRKASRLPKLSPSLFFSSNVKYALYIDGKLELKIHPIDYLHTYVYNNHTIVNKPNHINNHINSNYHNNKLISMVAIRHPFSKSITEESNKILDSLKQRKTVTRYPNILTYQTDYYNYYKYSKNISYKNIFDGALLLHNLHSKISKQFRCMWYEEFLAWADRDQIPGPFAISNMIRLSSIKHFKQYKNIYNNSNRSSIFNDIFHKELEYIPIGYNEMLQQFEYIRLLSSSNQNHWDLQHYNIAIQKRETFAL